MSDDLGEMLEAQRELQVDSFDLDPCELPDAERMEFIRWNVLALEDELHEFLGETGWKVWSTSEHVNRDAAMSELVDAFHFFLNLIWATGGVGSTAGGLRDEFIAAYFKKRDRNAERQAEGYDGIQGKCPSCRRDYKDAGVECTPATEDEFAYCATKAKAVSS